MSRMCRTPETCGMCGMCGTYVQCLEHVECMELKCNMWNVWNLWSSHTLPYGSHVDLVQLLQGSCVIHLNDLSLLDISNIEMSHMDVGCPS